MAEVYQLSAKHGNALTPDDFGHCLENDSRVSIDLQQSVECYERSAAHTVYRARDVLG
jgi:hypothetical protein